MAHNKPPRYCPDCGDVLLEPLPSPDGGPPLACRGCGMPIYLDPKVAAACVVTMDNGVVLLRRAQHDEAYGRWILPGGHVNRGEAVDLAAQRETQEETGLKVEIKGLLGVYSYPGNPVVLVVYRAGPVAGVLNGSGEALEIKSFRPEEIPWDDLGYQSTHDALKDLLDSKS